MLRAVALASAIAQGTLGNPLSDALLGLQFLHTGRTNSSSAYSFFPIHAGYLEPENVTCSMCGWGQGGGFPYLYATGSAPAYTCKALGPFLNNTDLPGGDLDAQPLPAGSPAAACQARCCGTAGCSAFTFAAKAPSDFLGCKAGDACCYLKSAGGAPNAFPGLVSGTVTPGDPPAMAAPDFGMRSAVPLGGLGAGTVELRGDGTFHELTIHNAHPSGQGKLGVLADALLGMRIDSPTASLARAIRTQAPAYAPAGVDSLEYSGAYPASRLTVVDAGVGGFLSASQVFAYPVFAPASEAAMAHPAIAFSLVATNALTTAVNVTLYMALPWGAINDCDRTGDGKNTLVAQPGLTVGECVLLASNTSACAAWTWKEDPQAATGTCTLTSDTNLFRGGKSSCGVTGGWVQSSASSITFVADANGNSPTSPSLGDTTLMAATEEAVDTQLLYANSPGDLWSAFATPAAPPSGVAPPGTSPAAGGWGSLSTTITLPPGATGEVTLIWSWHFRACARCS